MRIESNSTREHIFLFAHQDDEFGVFPLLELLARRKERIRCIYLTDGASKFSNPSVRNRESLHVLGRYGIPDVAVTFLGEALGIGDGQLHGHLERAGKALATLLADKRTKRVYVPAYEGGHHDHDCTHALGIWLKHNGLCDRVIQFPLYHGKNLPGPWFKVTSPIEDNGRPRLFKYSLASGIKYCLSCLAYRSQWRTWVGLWPFFAFACLVQRRQILQRAGERVFFGRPHAGSLFYERRFGVAYETLAEAIGRLHDQAA
jgi:hypothetical protein